MLLVVLFSARAGRATRARKCSILEGSGARRRSGGGRAVLRNCCFGRSARAPKLKYQSGRSSKFRRATKGRRPHFSPFISTPCPPCKKMLLKRWILCYHLDVFGDAPCGVASARTPLHGGRARSPLRQTGAGFPARSSIRTKSLRSAGVTFRIVKSRPFGLQSRPDSRRNKDARCGRCACP